MFLNCSINITGAIRLCYNHSMLPVNKFPKLIQKYMFYSTKPLFQKKISNNTLFHTNTMLRQNKNVISQKVKTVRLKVEKLTEETSKHIKTLFKDMPFKEKIHILIKDYSYIIIPVHTLTSIGWIYVLYTLIKNEVDLIGILEYFKVNLSLIDTLRNRHPHLGNLAFVMIIFNIITPVRYFITIIICFIYIKKIQKHWGIGKRK